MYISDSWNDESFPFIGDMDHGSYFLFISQSSVYIDYFYYLGWVEGFFHIFSSSFLIIIRIIIKETYFFYIYFEILLNFGKEKKDKDFFVEAFFVIYLCLFFYLFVEDWVNWEQFLVLNRVRFNFNKLDSKFNFGQ